MIQSIDINNQNINDLNYFSFCNLTNKTNLPPYSTPIGDILSVFVSPKIISSRIIDAMSGESSEGFISKGKSLIVDIIFYEKILYTEDKCNSQVNVLNLEFIHSSIISLPSHIEGSEINKLLNINRLKPNIYIYGVSNYKLDSFNILNNIYSIVDIQYVPTYQLCYSTYDSLNISRIFMCHSNGSNTTLKSQINFCKIFNLKWSLDGQSIAYVKKSTSGNSLCLYSLNKSFTNKNLTEIFLIKNIKDYIWKDSSTIIYCTNNEDNQNLYLINTKTHNVTQLTFNTPHVYCEKPKYSIHSDKIVFIRKDSKSSLLYEMDSNGLKLKQLSTLKDVMDFAWSIDGNFIAAVVSLTDLNDTTSMNGIFSTLSIFDLSTETEINLTGSLEYKSICKVIPSSDTSKFIFIANCGNKDDIFTFDYIKNRLVNLTKNSDGVFISDICCNFDGSLLYYSSNELGFYNIFSYEFKTFSKTHIISTNALNIHLDYRPSL